MNLLQIYFKLLNLLQIYNKIFDKKQIYMYFELNKNREKCSFEASKNKKRVIKNKENIINTALKFVIHGSYILTSKHHKFTMESSVDCYKRVRLTLHTHKPGNAYKTKPSPQYKRYIILCSSCLFVACSVTLGRKVKVSKL